MRSIRLIALVVVLLGVSMVTTGLDDVVPHDTQLGLRFSGIGTAVVATTFLLARSRLSATATRLLNLADFALGVAIAISLWILLFSRWLTDLGAQLGNAPDEGRTYFYWALVAYTYSPLAAIALFAACLAGIAILAFKSIPRWRTLAPHQKSAALVLPVGLLLVSQAFCSFAFPANCGGTIHLASYSAAGRAYHLSESPGCGGFGYWTLWKCDRWGLMCKGKDFTLHEHGYARSEVGSLTLAPDPVTGKVVVEVDGTAIPVETP